MFEGFAYGRIIWRFAIVLIGISSHASRSFASPPSFYVYDLPQDMVDVWPPRGVALGNKSVWKHAFNDNEGFGRQLLPKRYYDTWQFALFRIFLSRLIRSPLRTADPDVADAFIVPYDIGAEAYVQRDGQFRSQLGNPLGSDALEFLRRSEHFQRNGCRDHVFFFSANIVSMRLTAVFRNLFNACRNATILTGEVPKHMQQSYPYL